MNADGTEALQLILLLPISLAFWVSVIIWIRRLNAYDALDGFRPTANSVSATEQSLPDLREVTR